MKGLNKVTLIGNLGKDPENIIIDAKTTVTKFSLATSDSYKDDKGKKHNTTEWHTVVMWNNLANFAIKYLKKGSSIYLGGKLKTRIYETKEGEKRQITEIIADNFIMLDKPE